MSASATQGGHKEVKPVVTTAF